MCRINVFISFWSCQPLNKYWLAQARHPQLSQLFKVFEEYILCNFSAMNIQRRSWLLFRDLKVPRFNKCQFYNKFMSKIFIFMHIWNESKSQISLGHFIIDMIYLSLITLSTRYSTRFNEWFQRVHILVGMEKKYAKYGRLKNIIIQIKKVLKFTWVLSILQNCTI